MLGQVELSFLLDTYGFPLGGIRRNILLRQLRALLTEQRIKIHWGWQLLDIQEESEEVIAIAEVGMQLAGSFVVGCDGIHSVTRRVVLGEHHMPEVTAKYKDLVQVSEVPASDHLC